MQSDGTWTVLLLVEGPRDRAALTRCLEEDYRVFGAASVKPALEILEREEVDLILCDQNPPDDAAIDFLREARIKRPEAIRVLLTAATNREDLVRSINDAAVYQVVLKPWNAAHLLLMVKRALESRELARRHRYLSREL